MYEDKTLVCKECGNEFVFTAGEQEFYAEKGFVNEPQRCKASFQANGRQVLLLQRLLCKEKVTTDRLIFIIAILKDIVLKPI